MESQSITQTECGSTLLFKQEINKNDQTILRADLVCVKHTLENLKKESDFLLDCLIEHIEKGNFGTHLENTIQCSIFFKTLNDFLNKWEKIQKIYSLK